MARWEPNARERLGRAALDLFVERGYEATTVAEIADRAGLTKSTFFRYYADKRDVLSAGQDVLMEAFGDAIRKAPAETTTVGCIALALDAAAAAFTPDRHDIAPKRRAVVAANSELQERELLKSALLTSTMAEALLERGVEKMTAQLAAELAILAFGITYARWSEPENQQPYADIARVVLGELQERAAALGADTFDSV
jgi:AcrR family transcriptional regulator